MNAWSTVRTIAKRELAAYFESPVAYVFLVVFLLLSGFFTFSLGGFFELGEASLNAFFNWMPWLFLFLVPAVGMRLWSEERRQGTLELLLTLPVTTWQAIVAKFLASWLFLAIALALTFPIIITVNWLGDPDNGVIVADSTFIRFHIEDAHGVDLDAGLAETIDWIRRHRDRFRPQSYAV